VVDDDIDMRELIALTLRHRGFDVVAVADGTAAMATIVSEGADALVTDLQMPGYDGLTLCRSLRALRASPALPIVVFTGVGKNDARLEVLCHMNDIRVLHKPKGLGQIAHALMELTPTTATGFGIAGNTRSSIDRARVSDPCRAGTASPIAR
jgi:DNA-binding response OmpR family regulator